MKSPSPETPLKQEQHLFRELFGRLIDAILNRIFDLRPEKASRRSTFITILFILCGVVICFIFYPPPMWFPYISNIFSSLIRNGGTQEAFINSISAFLTFLRGVVTDPRILQYLPIFLAPFFIALQAAAMYLADVFELDDVSVARNFIRGVALTGNNETIRITHGDIAEDSKDSPVALIGGPGRVIVDLDSVALFERSDGTPHLIGPTGQEPNGKARIEGFERFRHALDIRDHHITLRDQKSSTHEQDRRIKSVKSRSRDGIPITATDVKLMFSIYRGNNNRTPTSDHPYPFSKEAVEQIVYKAASRVTPGQRNTSTYDFSWINNMIVLIRARLGGFMGEHKLTEYLASIGAPEIEKRNLREAEIKTQMQELTRNNEGAGEQRDLNPPTFQARDKVKNLFAQFTDEFTRKARERGVELHWIGVGTWDSPIKEISDKHLEAWELAQENLQSEIPEKIVKYEQEEVVKKLSELIRKVPIAIWDEIMQEYQYNRSRRSLYGRGRTPFNKGELISSENDDKRLTAEEMEKFTDMLQMFGGMADRNNADEDDLIHWEDMRTLLTEFFNQFTETRDLIESKGETAHPDLLEAISILDKQINAHWVRR